MAEAMGADLVEIKPKKELKGVLAYIVGGFQAIHKKTPEILPLGKDPKDYDLIVIGTPVWASNFAPPIRTFLVNAGLKGKKIALFCCYGGQAGKTFDEMKKLLEGNEIVGEIGFKLPLKQKEENEKKAKEFAKAL